MSKQVKQTQVNLTTIPAAITQAPPPPKIETKPQTPQKNPQPQPTIKPIPRETKILLEAIEEIENILYATRQRIWQLYGPIDYSQKSDIENAFLPDTANNKPLNRIDSNRNPNNTQNILNHRIVSSTLFKCRK